jgi:hypothetical protein
MKLDRDIWKHLPNDLIWHILGMAKLSIDARLAFRIRPKKLDEVKCWRFWHFLKSHDGLVYNLDSKTLHIFRIPGHHIIRRPIDLDFHTEGMVIFNSQEDEHLIETISPSGDFMIGWSTAPWVTECRVIFRRANPGRKQPTEDIMY